jgi:hypothetical protein
MKQKQIQEETRRNKSLTIHKQNTEQENTMETETWRNRKKNKNWAEIEKRYAYV